ncbi:N-(5'-phosphoribosyl)anthranilate isomerase [Tabrizicola soli]|uniref:N-(5'-phosphoribosyl)anthranilate isomerase n=1 Tax=Tabrizicola soli TaxID=2185115 RepID=A0ABV7DSY9_9RHOB|nr:N-(5'-phosphoribosyl)anthranilate isomerase [Tabrizicola soli]
MSHLPEVISPEKWIVHLFSAKSVAEGGTVRRKVSDVERLVGRERFLHEVLRRGFRVVENAGQFIIFCNREPVHVLA